ncbi:MAG: DNA repair protein RecO [Pseudomonadota bacterium]
MSFRDIGLVLEIRAHGEAHAVAHILTENHGRRAGLVHGGQGRRLRPILQPGNDVALDWKGRGDSLGYFDLELTRARAAEVMDDRVALAGLAAVCATAFAVLPEGEAVQPVFRGMTILLDNLDDLALWPALMARWELGLLAALGFGLTLDRCAATGARENLVFVSPRSACAVSESAGAPYREKLLPLPAFLIDAAAPTDLAGVIDGLTTTGYFLETRVLHPADRQLPEARGRLIELLKKRAELSALSVG